MVLCINIENEVSKIDENIFLCGIPNYNDIDTLTNIIKYNSISVIISVWDLNKLNIDLLGISKEDYLYIECKDDMDQNITKYFDIVYNFIDKKIKNNKNILIHCSSGISRSPSILISYFIRKDKKTFREILSKIREKRIVIEPNFNFCIQLIKYEKNYINY